MIEEAIKDFILEGLPIAGIETLEEFSDQWMDKENNPIKDCVLPYIINEKLKIYEEEY